jgi:hypothetical protein
MIRSFANRGTADIWDGVDSKAFRWRGNDAFEVEITDYH